MESPLDNALNGVAQAISNKWYAVMGLFGLVIVAATLLTPIPTDPRLAMSIGLIMIGFGFGHTECKTEKVTVYVGRGQVTAPAWKWTTMGALLHMLGFGACSYLAYTLIIG
jgi:hypothetical protein